MLHVGCRIDNFRVNKFKLGVVEKAWENNYLFAGHSGVNLGQMVFSELSLIQSSIVQFLDVYVSNKNMSSRAKYYNEMWSNFTTDAQDFTLIHGFITENIADLIVIIKNEALDSLLRRVTLFTRLGRLPPSESDAVTDQQWYALLYGFGFRPELFSVMLMSMDLRKMYDDLDKLRFMLKNIQKGMPTHKVFIEKILKNY